MCAQPIAWCRNTDDTKAVQLGELHRQLWVITERYLPGYLVVPPGVSSAASLSPSSLTLSTTSSNHNTTTTANNTRASCALCCADMNNASGFCDVCNTVLYETSMNSLYQNHHTIGGASPPPVLSSSPAVDSNADVSHHHAQQQPQQRHHARGIANSGAVYQRRAQFRAAIASYQGRPTRPVPDAVVEEVRQQIESSAQYLVDATVPLEDPRRRYAGITRVHILSLLRGSGNGRYSRWYRDSHYLHHVITQQTPPDLSDCENILMLMFGMGMLSVRCGSIFFCRFPTEYSKTHMVGLYTPESANGERLLMIGMELMMTLYALLYAFPHIPSTLLEESDLDLDPHVDEAGRQADPTGGAGGDEEEEAPPPPPEKQWFSVTSTEAMRAALDALLQTSEVLESSLPPGRNTSNLTRTVVADARRLSDFLGLRLYDDGVPATCRQMYESIAAIYDALNRIDVTTREELWTLYQRYQIISMDYQLPGLERTDAKHTSGIRPAGRGWRRRIGPPCFGSVPSCP